MDLNSVICEYLGHRWNYSASSEPSRVCDRCGLCELPVPPFFDGDWTHPTRWEIT